MYLPGARSSSGQGWGPLEPQTRVRISPGLPLYLLTTSLVSCGVLGKWWPLTRKSGDVSDALGSVWGFTSFCVFVELIYIGVLAFTPFFYPFWVIFEVLWWKWGG